MKKKASSFYLACPLQVYLYLELIVGGETVMGGNEGAHGKIGRKECGTSRQPCAAFLHIPTKLCYSPFQNGPLFEGAKNNETRKYTPNTQVLNGPF